MSLYTRLIGGVNGEVKIPIHMTNKLTIVALIAALCAPTFASAQKVEMVVDSPWGAWASDVKVTFAVSPLRRNIAGQLEAIPGQRVSVGAISFLQKSITVTFPGQKSTPMTVAGLRLHYAASGTGWVMPERPINVTLPAVIEVPAGRKLTCFYDMPIATKGKVTCFPALLP